MLFKDIIGQASIKSSLIKTVQEGRISHAQLFLGPEGSGNLAMAMAYATYISCPNRNDTDACGTCPSCQKFAKQIHPDLHIIYPIAATKDTPTSTSYIETWRKEFAANPYLSLAAWNRAMDVENKQTLIAVKESEEITRKVSMMAYEAPFNFIIIWMPGKMNAEAANKMLKVLEEPPGKSLFLLVEHNDEDLLATVASRLLTIRIPRLADQEISQALIDRFNCDPNEALRIAYLADGNYSRAQELASDRDEENLLSDRFIQWSRICFANQVAEMVDWVEDASGWGRERQKNFIQYAIHLIRENLFLSLGMERLVRLEDAERSFSDRFHAYISPANAQGLLDIFSKAQRDIERNANPRILFLDLSFEYGTLLKGKAEVKPGHVRKP